MKKLLSLLLCVLLVCTLFSGCGETDSGKLVICFDFVHPVDNKREVDSFLDWLDNCNLNLGLPISSKDVEVEVLTYNYDDPAERSATLQRLRSEIMAGKGPDVFVCADFEYVEGAEFLWYDSLFSYPEKARESGLFLPLDEYLSDLTLTNVEEMIPQVLESGKNQKGEQVILPMAFTVPGVIYVSEEGAELPEVAFEDTSWEDVLNGDDPLLAAQVNWFLKYENINYGTEQTTYDDRFKGAHTSGLFCLVPQVADLENETLCLSEEELTALVKDSFAAYHRTAEQGEVFPGSSKYLSVLNFWDAWFGGRDYSFTPLRNAEGGSTAVVTQYCAVSANTKKKDKALTVIDALLCKEYQKRGALYELAMEMPMYLDLVSPETNYLNGWLNFTPEQHDMWKRICEDINIVRFPSLLDKELDNMMTDIEDAMMESLPADVEKTLRDGRLAICTISDERLEEIISEHYRQMQRLLDES